MMYQRTKLVLCVFLMTACLFSCSQREPGGADTSSEPKGEVVLYSSMDGEILREVADLFESQTGITVKLVTDTEATKTTGLVQRLLAEQGEPGADVWWSSEPFGTVMLAERGVFEPYRSEPAESGIGRALGGESGQANGAGEGAESAVGWPASLRGRSGDWYGFALRRRVLAYDASRVPNPPRTLAELAATTEHRVGIADPRFGTTRGHVSALLHAFGERAYRDWLDALFDNGLVVYSSNSAAVRGIAQGEVDMVLTDNDDVLSGRENGWNIEMVDIGSSITPDNADASADVSSLPFPAGPMYVPGTVALVRSGPNPDNAKALIDFLLSERVSELLSEPIWDARSVYDPGLPVDAGVYDLGSISGQTERALRLFERARTGG